MANDNAHYPLDWRRIAFRVFLFLAGSMLFLSLRGFAVVGGDTPDLTAASTSRFCWEPRWFFNAREPLAHLLVLKTYHLVHDKKLAFALVSSLCGGAWLVLLSLFPRQSLLFWLVNLLSSITMMFMGHLEFYAPILVALTALFLALTHALEFSPRRLRPWHVLSLWGLAVLTHKLAFFYLPALLPLVWNIRERRMRDLPRREWRNLLLTVIAISLALQIPAWLNLMNIPFMRVRQLDNRVLELLTLPKGWADAVARKSVMGAFQIFYFGSLDHFRYFSGFLLMSAPLGLPLALLGWRRLIRNPALAGLGIAACCSLIWTFFWHPHMGWRDWDLFGTAGLAINLLAGYMWSAKPCVSGTALSLSGTGTEIGAGAS